MMMDAEDIRLLIQMREDIFELKRRLANVLQLGEIVETKDNRLYSVDVGGSGPIPDVAKAESFFGGEASGRAPLSKGDLVLLASPNGNLTGATIIGAIPRAPSEDQSSDYAVSFKDGLSVRYQRESKKLSVSVPEGGAIEISSPSGLVITGDLRIDGKLTITKSASAKDFEAEGGIKLSKHKHSVDVSKATTLTTEADPAAAGG